ncbi:uncharacterized protein Z520_02230 [Fonsecaea multimorphosa CBS 102226]|uniref:VWFA domain-containing protein n=1 Tax=Fonsecaea multimorphosa CBS 102226 TaxID=1442371 RepID=A0A0D2IYF7_9EURO|nr:uncharacterized protein Z520_02230 [Fonsecaea multimorphosa CBS 102226]KIY02092.1 hypothetical protein Z520_02230 [Fonsecaea multimorphosa CBS 102226]OAL29291.1 hypothetical protein AYO22_02185 [Fonsecaea multimorphosa]
MDLKTGSNGFAQEKAAGNGVDLAFDASQQAAADQYSCERCDETMDPALKDEHEDWHFARDLQAQEDGSTAAAPSTTQATAKPPPPDLKQAGDGRNDQPPDYAPPSYPPPSTAPSRATTGHRHTNKVIEAGKVRARDEQQMQNALQRLQFQYNIYNSEIEPEHETDFYCSCPIHQYQRMKWSRYGVQDMWSRAVMYPGEKAYTDNPQAPTIFSGNPYRLRVISPYGYTQSSWGVQVPRPKYHAQSIHQTIALNNRLNAEAQAKIDELEPKVDIWNDAALEAAMSQLSIMASIDKKASIKAGDEKAIDKKAPIKTGDEKAIDKKAPIKGGNEKNLGGVPEKGSSSASGNSEKPAKSSKLSSFRQSIGIKSSKERAVGKAEKMVFQGRELRDAILAEEAGRWPDEQWRHIVAVYQEKVGMSGKIAYLRARQPIQYLHLLRAGYFEPIPVAWATQASNPLKFSIEAASGWRGITPAWRGYEDTAEERLYWVLNHREGSVGMRMKPDFISEMDMARARMATAVEPPPEYYSATDTCHIQHTSEGYSRQVMPRPFVAYDRPEMPTDDTMILLDVSGSMDFDPLRPIYDQYLITGYKKSTQPKNKDVAKAVIRRFTDAMANHDHQFQGYDMVTFSSSAEYIGTINHQNLNQMWNRIHIGGGTRVMTGWQKVKELHFQKHSESATHHPVYGWQAGPETPMLRLLLLLDGEATDMDEFELDLLGLSWAHVTIFLIGVDGCPHHHRHANELQRISDVNHHVSFVDAQGNTPERFVTHELLKRHLGYEISMTEFEGMEELPEYTA